MASQFHCYHAHESRRAFDANVEILIQIISSADQISYSLCLRSCIKYEPKNCLPGDESILAAVKVLSSSEQCCFMLIKVAGFYAWIQGFPTYAHRKLQSSLDNGLYITSASICYRFCSQLDLHIHRSLLILKCCENVCPCHNPYKFGRVVHNRNPVYLQIMKIVMKNLYVHAFQNIWTCNEDAKLIWSSKGLRMASASATLESSQKVSYISITV